MDYLDSMSLKELETLYRKEKDGSVKLRLLMVIHRKQGRNYRDIGDILRVSAAKAHFWAQRFSAMGIKGLQRKRREKAHNRYLTAEQEQLLKEKLKQQPMTSREVRVYIKDSFGKLYHPNSIPRLLRRLGQSLITPRPRNYRANPRSGRAFKGHIKKVAFVEV